MLELILIVMLVSAMAKIASAEDRSALTWGGMTLVLCIGSLFAPLPFLRVLIAGAVVFGAMTLTRSINN